MHTFQPPEAAAHTRPYSGVAPFCVYDWRSEKYSSGAFDLPTECLNCLFLLTEFANNVKDASLFHPIVDCLDLDMPKVIA